MTAPPWLAEAAQLLRRVLEVFPTSGDRAPDRVVRRRAEGAVIAAELGSGAPAPRRMVDGEDAT